MRKFGQVGSDVFLAPGCMRLVVYSVRRWKRLFFVSSLSLGERLRAFDRRLYMNVDALSVPGEIVEKGASASHLNEHSGGNDHV